MPLVRISLFAGKPADYRRAIGDGIHQAMVETLAVPEHDRFQIFSEHDAGGIIYDVATASTAAKNYNKRHHLQVTPIVAPTTASAVVGVGISGSF